MSRVQEEQFHFCTCSNCFGNWSPKPNLLHWVLADTPVTETPSNEPSLQELAGLVTESDLKRPLTCTQCRHTMRINRLHLMVPVDVQECLKCGYVWTDVGKRALIKKLFHAMQTSTNPRIAALREKYAVLEAADAIIDAKAATPKTRNGYTDSLSLVTVLDMLVY